MYRQFIRMTEQCAVFKERADLAEDIIKQLKGQVEVLKRNAACYFSKDEETRLKEENEKLKAEIEKVKIQLTLEEVKAGIKQAPKAPRRKVTTQPVEELKPAKTQETNKAENGEKKKIAENTKAQQSKKTEKKEKKANPAPMEEKMDVSRLDFRIGTIVKAEKHADADTLYIENVDLGEERLRIVVSGLVRNVPLDQMQNKTAVFMCNLKPAKLKGILSEAMIMCAVTDDKTEILDIPKGCVPGDRVHFDGFTDTPDTQLNPKKKVWETLKPDLVINSEGIAIYKGAAMNVDGKGIVKAPTIKNGRIQ